MKKYKQIITKTNLAGAMPALEALIRKAILATDVVVELSSPRRTLDQNAKMWAMLTDVSRQAYLVINGEKTKASPSDWKAVFTAALTQENRVALGIDGGIVYLGQSTSRMTKRQLADLIELINAYGANNGIRFTAGENYF